MILECEVFDYFSQAWSLRLAARLIHLSALYSCSQNPLSRANMARSGDNSAEDISVPRISCCGRR